ncbi:MAG: ABC transporter ATP-binding protein [Actinomycetota bacterium]
MSGIGAILRVVALAPRSQQRKFVVAQIGVVLMVVAQLVIPLLIQDIIDDGIIAEDLGSISRTAFAMICWSVANLAVAGGVAYLSASAATDFAHAIRTHLYDKISTLSYGNIDRLSSAGLLVRMTSDVNIMRTSFMMTMFMLFQAPWLLLGAVGLVWWQTPELLWVMGAVVVVTAAFVLVVAPALGPLYARAQQRLDRLNLVFRENIAGIRVVKAFNRDELETTRFQERNHDLYEAQLRPAFRVATFQPVLFGLLYGAVGLAVVVVGPDIADGVVAADPDAVTPGELTTFFNYLLTAMIPIMIVAFVLPELSKFQASLERAIEVFETEPDVQQPTDPVDPGEIVGRIEFRDVSMSYLDDDGQPGSLPVLAGLDFTIEPGETVAILGQTGSGKTSLINLIPRFYDATEGAVLIDGHDVRDLDLDALRRQIGIAPQQAQLFAGSIIENLRYGNVDSSFDEVQRAAEIADAHEFISSQVAGYDSVLAEQANNLSGGQRQRLSLARAINSDPRILLLDDTTSAVDVATEARIQQRLREELAGRTVVIVAQRISTAIGADKIVLLDDGRVDAIGTHADLMATSAAYAEIVESQLGSIDEVVDLLEHR